MRYDSLSADESFGLEQLFRNRALQAHHSSWRGTSLEITKNQGFRSFSKTLVSEKRSVLHAKPKSFVDIMPQVGNSQNLMELLLEAVAKSHVTLANKS